jgi:hypothetical protein
MMILSSLPGRQAKGLRHSSRGRSLRNAMLLESLRPVRALQRGHSPESQSVFIRLSAEAPNELSECLCTSCSNLAKADVHPWFKIRAQAPKIFKPTQGCANLCKAASPPPGGGIGRISRINPNQGTCLLRHYGLIHSKPTGWTGKLNKK